jgi:hypothetical protein
LKNYERYLVGCVCRFRRGRCRMRSRLMVEVDEDLGEEKKEEVDEESGVV